VHGLDAVETDIRTAPAQDAAGPVERILSRVNRLIVIVSSVALVAAACVLTYSVASRYFLHFSTDWQDELSVFLIVVLSLIAVATSFNSGTVLCIVVHVILVVAFFYLLYRVLANNDDKSYTKVTVVRYRVFLMIHLTAVVAVFWVTFSIILLGPEGAQYQGKELSLSFFQAVFGIGTGRSVLCVLVLIFFLATLLCYGFILYFHQRALGILDEIASLNIMERTGRGMSKAADV